ncbi:hypothetical protein JCM11491_005300 [Sporobolomyces phaffii]
MGLLSLVTDRAQIATPLLGKALLRAAITDSALSKWGQEEALKGAPLVSLTNAQLIHLGKATDQEAK